MVWFRNSINDGSIPTSSDAKLTADIDLTGADGQPSHWQPIGGLLDYSSRKYYSGTFDGGGYSVEGYTVTSASVMNPGGWYAAGFFGIIANSSTIKRLTLLGGIKVDVGVDDGNTILVGGIVGNNDGGTITNCAYFGIGGASASAAYRCFFGGISGGNSGTITNCIYSGTSGITANGGHEVSAGGIVGMNSSIITNCVYSNTGSVSASGGSTYNYAGGIVGDNNNSGNILNCGWLKTGSLDKGVGNGAGESNTFGLTQNNIKESVVTLMGKLTKDTVEPGGTANISLTTLPGNPEILGNYVKDITVTVSDHEILSNDTGSENGTITLRGVREGKATVAVSVDLYPTDFSDTSGLKPLDTPTPLSFTFDVTVSNIPATGITISPNNMKLNVGESGKFTATLMPDNATDKSVTWLSSDEKVAVVDGEGNVKAIAEGSVTITVKTADGAQTAKATVTVVTPNGPDAAIRHGGGSGCAAGTGALAMLALIPLWLRRRKK
ncbi:Ig-like domain-containing protein [Cloacibacillus porcorum]